MIIQIIFFTIAKPDFLFFKINYLIKKYKHEHDKLEKYLLDRSILVNISKKKRSEGSKIYWN